MSLNELTTLNSLLTESAGLFYAENTETKEEQKKFVENFNEMLLQSQITYHQKNSKNTQQQNLIENKTLQTILDTKLASTYFLFYTQENKIRKATRFGSKQPALISRNILESLNDENITIEDDNMRNFISIDKIKIGTESLYDILSNTKYIKIL